MAKGFLQGIRNAFSAMTAKSRFVTPETRGEAETIQARIKDIEARLTERHERVMKGLLPAPDLAYRPPGATPSSDKTNQARRQTEKYNRSVDRINRVEKAILDTLEKNQFRAPGDKLKASLLPQERGEKPDASKAEAKGKPDGKARAGSDDRDRAQPKESGLEGSKLPFSEEAARRLADRLAEDPVALALKGPAGSGPATRVFNEEVERGHGQHVFATKAAERFKARGETAAPHEKTDDKIEDKDAVRDGDGERGEGGHRNRAGEKAEDYPRCWENTEIREAYERYMADDIARAEKPNDNPHDQPGPAPGSGPDGGHDPDPGRTL